MSALEAIKDREENSQKFYKVTIIYFQEEMPRTLYFNCLDLYEVKQIITIMSINYKIQEIKVKELEN